MSQRVLVVEDDRHIGQVVSEYLKDAGYIVSYCADGLSAREAIGRDDGAALFILDIMLPGRTGLELLRDIREDERHSEKPVIMLTALGDENTQLESFDALADDYVTKPFSPKVLVKRVKALLRRSGTGQGQMRFGELELDSERYEVYEGGRRLTLTLREFELLSALMSSPRKVLSRQQLLNRAWGYDYFGDERIVDVHVKNLRKKLDSNIIATVKGVGYKLELPREEAGNEP